jgi:hypothetical protein
MSAAVAGAFALVIAYVLWRKKKTPKLVLVLVVGGVSSLVGGIVADYLRSWFSQVDKAASDFTNNLIGTPLPLLGLVAVAAMGFLIFELLPKAKPKPNTVWLAVLLPLLAPAIPGRAGDATTKVVSGVNAATTSVIGGLFSDGPGTGRTPRTPVTTVKPKPAHPAQPAAAKTPAR